MINILYLTWLFLYFQIKVLQQFASQQGVMQNSLANGKGSSTAMGHLLVQMTKTKQQISSLQVNLVFIYR